MLYTGNGLDSMQMIEADDVCATTFPNMLSRLEHLNLLKPDSQIRNFSTIMALYTNLGSENDMPHSSIDITTKIKTNNPSTPSITYRASEFRTYILAYTRKYNIIRTGPPNLLAPDDLNDLKDPDDPDDPEIVLETTNLTDNIDQDPWYLVPATALYARNHASYPNGRDGFKSALGGDDLDITSWTSKDRKKCSFDGKDQLSKENIGIMKKGMVLVMA